MKSTQEKISVNDSITFNPSTKMTSKNISLKVNIQNNNSTNNFSSNSINSSNNITSSFQSNNIHSYTKSNGNNNSITNVTSQNSNSNTDNLKVAIRIRPPLSRELEQNLPFRSIIIANRENHSCSLVEYIGAELDEAGRQKEWISSPQMFQLHRFTFDEIFDIETSQEEIFNISAKPAVNSVLEGYNSTIFAYGQTGTGKTFTMEGFTYNNIDNNRGIIPRTIENIFNYIESNSNKNNKFIIRAAYLQIYNEMISDLLKPDNTNKNLNIREDKKKGLYVENLSEWAVRNPNDIYTLLERGASSREVSNTNMNDLSSRSHAVFMIIVEQLINFDNNKQITKIGKLNLVDLAGSERTRVTGATGKQLEESKKINKSLSALGNVINALTDTKERKHIPYRDSKLTRLLENSLGGNCKTTMIATISPAQCSFNESLSTLNFAKRAKNIKNRPIINEDIGHNCLIHQYENELRRIKNELSEKMKIISSTEEILKLKNREEKEKNDAIKAYEQTSKQLILERNEKLKLENKLRLMNLQMIKGGEKIEETPQFKSALQEKQTLLEKDFQQRIKQIEKEKEQIEDSKSQVEAYNKLLYQQRDIMNKLTISLNEKDELISDYQKTITDLNNKILELNNFTQLENDHIEEMEKLLDKNKIPYQKFSNMNIALPVITDKYFRNKIYIPYELEHNGNEYIGQTMTLLSSEEKIKELNEIVSNKNKEITLLKQVSEKIFDNNYDGNLNKKFNELQNENMRLNSILIENSQLVELQRKENESLEEHYNSIEKIFQKTEKENLKLINTKEKLIWSLEQIIKKLDTGIYNSDHFLQIIRTDLINIFQIVLDNHLNEDDDFEDEINIKKKVSIDISNIKNRNKNSSNNINNSTNRRKVINSNGINKNVTIHDHKELSSENLKNNLYIDKNSYQNKKYGIESRKNVKLSKKI